MWTIESTGIAAPLAVSDLQAVVDHLRTWDDAAVRYQVRLELDRVAATATRCMPWADEVRMSPDCNAVINGRFVDPHHPYRKWQGAHWALVQLAERGHPGGDPRLKQIQ